MNIDSLKLFCDVVRLQSFSDAARENRVTQAAASQSVRQLEKRLKAQLIDRKKRPFQLTELGTLFFDGSKNIVEQYALLEKQIASVDESENVTGTVRVAAIYSAGLEDISRTVQRFTALYPACDVELSYLHPKKVVQSVLAGDSDLGIISYPRSTPELHTIPWKEERLVLVVPTSHRFATAAPQGMQDLNGESFVAFDRDLTIRKEIDRYLRHHKVEVEVRMTFDNVETMKRAVEIGEGIAILPETSLRNEVSMGTIQAVALPRKCISRPLGIIMKKNRKFFRATDHFVQMIKGEESRPETALNTSRVV